MAKFKAELPNELIRQFENLEQSTDEMLGEMCSAGAQVVYNLTVGNISKAFKTQNALLKGLKVTKVYKTKSDDSVNVHIGFYGYDETKASEKHPKGVPIPLIALAREYGTSSGERKKPFFRKSFKKSEIERAMLEVQKKYIKED